MRFPRITFRGIRKFMLKRLKEIESKSKKISFSSFLPIIVSLIATIVVLSIFFLVTNLAEGTDISRMWTIFINSTIGTPNSLLRTLHKTSFMLMLVLGLVIPYRAGLFNIGTGGQMTLGAIVAAGIVLYVPIPPIFRIFLAFISSFLVSGTLGGIVGWLKAKWDVDEIFLGLMLTFVMTALLMFIIDGPWARQDVGYSMSNLIPEATKMPFLASSLNSVFLISLACVPIVYFLLNKTVFGFELKVVGSGKKVAESQGIAVIKVYTLSMFLSGALSGLAGAMFVLGELYYLIGGMIGNLGFMAFPPLLMASGSVELVFFSSFFVTFLLQGTLGLTSLGLNVRLGEAIIGIVFITLVLSRKLRRRK